MYRGATHMKEEKLGAVNSYNLYKQRKMKKAQYAVLFSVVLFIVSILLGTGRLGVDLEWLLSLGRMAPLEEDVYLDGSNISYNLYSAPEVARGIYIPARKIENYDKYIKLAKETEVNSFVIDVKDDTGYLTFETENEVLISKGIVLAKPPIKDMKTLMNKLYEANIYPIARVVAFKDGVVAKREPERAVKNLNGEIYATKTGETWLDPYNKENWEYLLEISKEAARMGFKEIQFDYIRFHESMNENRVILNPEISKAEIITEFTQYICENLQKEGIKVSADVFGAVVLSDLDASIVGQDFKEMSRYLDYICPMIYPSHYAEGTFGIEYPNLDAYNMILKTLEIGQDKINIEDGEKRAVIRPWLQDFTLKNLKPYLEYGPKEIRDQIQGAYDAGVEEWLFWNAGGNYTEEGLIAE